MVDRIEAVEELSPKNRKRRLEAQYEQMLVSQGLPDTLGWLGTQVSFTIVAKYLFAESDRRVAATSSRNTQQILEAHNKESVRCYFKKVQKGQVENAGLNRRVVVIR